MGMRSDMVAAMLLVWMFDVVVVAVDVDVDVDVDVVA
jgi:hypothetical protein